LERIWLDGTQVSDLSPLAGCKNLRDLSMQETPVSDEQVQLLLQALPDCKIQFGSISKAVRSAEPELKK
jgi:hypothetical protein